VQVQNHQESTLRQYDLVHRARQLGWADDRIEVIDEDLGVSASDAARTRTGFQGLLAKVVTGEVGAVFSVEISRLARQDSEGHRLVEVSALTETLLIDEQQIYNPLLPDDRLMLGLKVLLSSNEIRLMGQRLRENIVRKAQRGELRLNLPVGLIFVPNQGIQLDPDEQVQGALRLVFERFRVNRRLSSVVQHFQENGLLFPRHKGCWQGKLEWGKLSLERTREVLDNPLYAGAYVYGRSKRQTVLLADQRIARPRQPLPSTQWSVCNWDVFEGYISRAEYEANKVRLEQNRANPHLPSSFHRRDGPALLGGMLLCGRCGQPMHVGYQGTNGSRSVYLCNYRQIRFAEKACQRIPGKAIDQFVLERVWAALTPAQIEVSLAAVNELAHQQIEVDKQWQRQLQAARYAADLAQRRYEQVDPQNRLVARTLEQQWEACLQEIDHLDAEFTSLQQKKPLTISADQRRALLNLAADLPKVWSAPTTSWTERKDLLELLVADVTLTRHDKGITVKIRWFTNQIETGELPLPVRNNTPTPLAIVERIRDLCGSCTDREIAEIFNQEELKTARGNDFSSGNVSALRQRHKITRRSTVT
jgi:DNA invertase Pin-like site-specific DNA recombinase